MNDIIPVEEYRGLSRDIRSNSIINTDRDAYLKAKMRKNSLRQKNIEYDEMKKQIKELMHRCDALEHIVSELKGINN
jgi:hypothetical protein